MAPSRLALRSASFMVSSSCRPKESDVYLGDTLVAAGGLEASAEATVAKRVARAQGAMFEAKSLVQDYRLQEEWREPGISGAQGYVQVYWPTVEAGSRYQKRLWDS